MGSTFTITNFVIWCCKLRGYLDDTEFTWATFTISTFTVSASNLKVRFDLIRLFKSAPSSKSIIFMNKFSILQQFVRQFLELPQGLAPEHGPNPLEVPLNIQVRDKFVDVTCHG